MYSPKETAKVQLTTLSPNDHTGAAFSGHFQWGGELWGGGRPVTPKGHSTLIADVAEQSASRPKEPQALAERAENSRGSGMTGTGGQPLQSPMQPFCPLGLM